jgi:hypothetical protein
LLEQRCTLSCQTLLLFQMLTVLHYALLLLTNQLLLLLL